MKKTTLLLIAALSISISGAAQQPGVSLLSPQALNLRQGLQIAPRGGYDLLPLYPKTNFIYESSFKGGPMAGLSADYYWDWIGAGIDGDYIRNKMILDFDGMETSSNITRIFYGIGPSFRYLDPTNVFSAELNLRGGMAYITQDNLKDKDGNEITGMHFLIMDGKKNVPSFKGQVRLTYFVNPWLGFHTGGYYMHHLNVPMDAEYFKNSDASSTTSINKSIASVGAFAGVTFRLAGFTAAEKKTKPEKKAEDDNLIKGKVIICNTKTPIEGVTVTVKDSKGQEKILTSNKSGEFSFLVTPNTGITIHGKKSNYFSQVVTLSAAELKRYKTVVLEICMERVDCDESVRLDNIHYDLDKYDIRPDARPELDRLVQFLLDNPEVKVELSSHTDSRASHDYNQKLSQNRANAARSYVISKGIDPSRIISVGYGETRLLNRCADGVNCSEEEHQLNRRTEMKVICPK